MTVYPLSALRSLALYTQRLNTSNGSEPGPSLDSVYETIDSLGAVQIDTLHVVARSQYLMLWSRHGAYDPKLLDRLAYDKKDRKLFEGWYHAACYVPLHEYRYQMPHQRFLREGPNDWYTRWLTQLHHKETVDFVRASVVRDGAKKVNDFERGDHPKGTWWNWRPAKVALEYLYAFGDFMIADRVNFQRVYDLTERILPKWVDTTEPTVEERDRFWIERGIKALGIGFHRNAADYTWMKLGKGRPLIMQMIKEGTLLEVQGETVNGVETLIIHRDRLDLLKRAAEGEFKTERTTFLSPFDNLLWAQGRDEAFWGFRQRLEAYTPAPKRIYGYFSLPILHKDKLVGRFDPKIERSTGLMRIKALHLEPGVKASDELVSDVAATMRDFMKFHNAKELVVENSHPAVFGKKLLKKV